MLLGLSVEVVVMQAETKKTMHKLQRGPDYALYFFHLVALIAQTFSFSTEAYIYRFLQPHPFTYSSKVKGWAWSTPSSRNRKIKSIFWCFIAVKVLVVHRGWDGLFLPGWKNQFRSSWSQRLGQCNRLLHITSTSMSYIADQQLVASGTVNGTSAFSYFVNTARCLGWTDSSELVVSFPKHCRLLWLLCGTQ